MKIVAGAISLMDEEIDEPYRGPAATKTGDVKDEERAYAGQSESFSTLPSPPVVGRKPSSTVLSRLDRDLGWRVSTLRRKFESLSPTTQVDGDRMTDRAPLERTSVRRPPGFETESCQCEPRRRSALFLIGTPRISSEIEDHSTWSRSARRLRVRSRQDIERVRRFVSDLVLHRSILQPLRCLGSALT